jgi:hypothetical protein
MEGAGWLWLVLDVLGGGARSGADLWHGDVAEEAEESRSG